MPDRQGLCRSSTHRLAGAAAGAMTAARWRRCPDTLPQRPGSPACMQTPLAGAIHSAAATHRRMWLAGTSGTPLVGGRSATGRGGPHYRSRRSGGMKRRGGRYGQGGAQWEGRTCGRRAARPAVVAASAGRCRRVSAATHRPGSACRSRGSEYSCRRAAALPVVMRCTLLASSARPIRTSPTCMQRWKWRVLPRGRGSRSDDVGRCVVSSTVALRCTAGMHAPLARARVVGTQQRCCTSVERIL